jgi:hypothetical protein
VSLGSKRQVESAGSPRCFGCFQLVAKELRVDPYAADVCVCVPHPPVFVPRHASMPGRAGPCRGVLGAFRWIGRTQVATPVVQGRHVLVIAKDTVTRDQPKQFSMQVDALSAHDVTLCAQNPAILSSPRDIVGVDDCVRLDQPVSREQRNPPYQPALAHRDRLGMSVVLTPRRAERPVLDSRRLPAEWRAARLTGQTDLVLLSRVLALLLAKARSPISNPRWCRGKALAAVLANPVNGLASGDSRARLVAELPRCAAPVLWPIKARAALATRHRDDGQASGVRARPLAVAAPSEIDVARRLEEGRTTRQARNCTGIEASPSVSRPRRFTVARGLRRV